MPAKIATKKLAASSKSTGKETAAKTPAKTLAKPISQFSLLAFDQGKTRIIGSYVGRSPPQVAKKVLKQHVKLEQKGRKGVAIYLRKAGQDKVSLYVGYREELENPIYAFQVAAKDPETGAVVQKMVKQKSPVLLDTATGKPVLDSVTGEPVKHKFLHSHYPRVVRVEVFPAGL